jgi:hypothetical protein
MPADSQLACLLRQLDTASRLARYHLDSLGNDECLWRPVANGLHVHQEADGTWRADWPEHEGYDLGPPSIAWLTWHIGFWWSMAIDHSFGQGSLTRGRVTWPGSADSARNWIYALETQWRSHITPLAAADLQSASRTRWPFRERPFADVIAWVNVELTKNAAEIGYARFLYAAGRQLKA